MSLVLPTVVSCVGQGGGLGGAAGNPDTPIEHTHTTQATGTHCHTTHTDTDTSQHQIQGKERGKRRATGEGGQGKLSRGEGPDLCVLLRVRWRV